MTPAKWKKLPLVKRLRANRGIWTDTEHNIVHPNDTMREAADEIEFLRARAEAAEFEAAKARDKGESARKLKDERDRLREAGGKLPKDRHT